MAHKPERLSFAEAAAAPLVTITAWEALRERSTSMPSKCPPGSCRKSACADSQPTWTSRLLKSIALLRFGLSGFHRAPPYDIAARHRQLVSAARV